MVTVSLARPRLRRRARALRPPLVAIRARNPCLFDRFRFRGLYVGSITASRYWENVLLVELEKIAKGVRKGQRLGDDAPWKTP